MLRPLLPAFLVSTALVAAARLSLAADAAQLTAADLLPASTAIYAEISQPAKVIDLVLDHPVHQRLREIDDYQQAFETPQYQQFLLGVKAFEGAVDMRWRPAAKLLTEGGAYFAADPATNGLAILVHSGDGAKLAALRDAVFTFVRADAQNRGREDPIKTGDYRGVTAYAIGETRFAIVGDWLVATNKSDLGKAILDRYLDAEKTGDAATGSLAGNSRFREARQSKPDAALGWAYADLAALREAGVAKQIFAGPRDNPLGEFLVGGILGMAKSSPFATLTLEADRERLAVTAALPFDPKGIEETRVYYFGPEGEGVAPPLAKIDNTVLQLGAYRDLAEFWAFAPELFDENIAAKFAEADSGLTTLFAGRDFGDEILGSVEPGIQIVVARQELPQEGLPAPDIKLPAFAAVFRLKEKANVQRNLKVSFQSLMGFLNVVGAMNGQPPLEQSNEKNGDVEIVAGAYLPPPSEEEARGLINYNFSPTAVFAGDRLVVSSTRSLAEKLAAANVDRTAAPPAVQTNMQVRLDTGALRTILDDNREQLIAQNMLEKGHGREEAEKEIGGLLELLTWVRDSNIQLTRNEGSLELQWSAVFASQQEK
jgi:hypothetical protein